MKTFLVTLAMFALAAPAFAQDADARAALALGSVAELQTRVTALEQKFAALEARLLDAPPLVRGTPPGGYPQTVSQVVQPAYYSQPAYYPVQAGYGAPYYDAPACGPGGCGPAAGYRFAPFGGTFRRK